MTHEPPYTSGSETWVCRPRGGDFQTTLPNRANCHVDPPKNGPCKPWLGANGSQGCNCTDQYGIQWNVTAGTAGKKDCIGPQLGQRTWVCPTKGGFNKTDGQFETENPNEDQCVDKWVDDIAKKVTHLNHN